MARESSPIPVRQGMSIRFINPEGSKRHMAPKRHMWRKTEASAPDGKKFPFYFRARLPFSTNINSGQGMGYYIRKGWNQVDDMHNPLPSDYVETNRTFRKYCLDCLERTSPEEESMKLMHRFLDIIQKHGSDAAVSELVKKEIAARTTDKEKELEFIEDEEPNVFDEE